MKAVDFDYLRPASVAELCRRLAKAQGEAKIIAGGQTLVPLLAMWLARPAMLLDINRLAELDGVVETTAEVVWVPARVRRRRYAIRRSVGKSRFWRRRSASSGMSRRAIAARSAAAWRMPIPLPISASRRWRSIA
jgi:hypothetical protein